MYRIVYLVLFLFSSLILKAQDPHFSQFYSTPLNFNPALAGTIDGTFRINTIYRDQWFTALDDPLTSFSLGADLKLPLNSRFKKKPDVIGLGIAFNSDRVSTFNLNSTSVNLIASFHKSLSQKKDKYLSLGSSFGINQRSVNYENLFFEDQYNTLDAFNLATSEVLPANNFGFIDLSVGLNYSDKTDTRKINTGIAFFHLNRPNISFYSQEDCAACIVETENRLKPKLTGYFSITSDINPDFAISPRLLVQVQDQFKELTLGTNLIFKLSPVTGSAFHIGTWLRGVDHVDSPGMESIIFMVGFEKKNFLLGLSYDHHIKDLTSYRIGLNAFELSFTYIGEHDNSFDLCPKF